MSNPTEGALGKGIVFASVLVALIAGLAAFIAPIHTSQELLRNDHTKAQEMFLTVVQGFQNDAKEDAYHQGKVDQQLADLRREADAKLAAAEARLQNLSDNTAATAERIRQSVQENRENINTLFERVRAAKEVADRALDQKSNAAK